MKNETSQLVVAGAAERGSIPVKEFEDGVPRVLDLEIAKWLGYAKPGNVRSVIYTHLAEIEALGIIRKTQIIHSGPGRPGIEYWLNEDQAIAVCQLSRGPQAAEVRISLRRLFRAYRQGKLAPSTTEPAALQLFSKLDRLSDSIALLASNIGDRMDRHDERIGRLENGQQALVEAVRDIAGRVGNRRRDLGDWTKHLHVTCVSSRRNGVCPCCQHVVVCTPQGRVDGAEFDHWYGRWRNKPEETWLVCAACNRALNASTEFKDRARSAFESYQQALRPFLGEGQLTLFQ